MGYKYDELGRLESLINENQESYHFEYDPLDRLKKEQGLDGLISEYHYDEIDNLLKKTVTTKDNQTQETYLEHNPIGEYSYKTVQIGEKQNQSAYKYDLRGNLIEAVNRTNRVAFEYNELGLITKETTEFVQNEEEIEKTLEHEYDELGNRVKTILPDKREVEYSYNEIGAVEKITIDGKTITTIQRDELNRELSRSQGVLESLKEYDSLGRLISQTTYNKEQLADVNTLNVEAELLHRTYSYNQAGELSEVNDKRLGKTTYTYDDIGQILQTVSPLQTETFSFDPAHNLLDPNNKEQTKVKNNQIETYEDKRYSYDGFGNLINKKIGNHTNIELEYDAEHQLIHSTIHKNNETKVYGYDYDPFGRRTRKVFQTHNDQTINQTTYFIWDGNRLLSEQTDKTTQTYIYEQNSFAPLALVDEQNNINYYHNDQIGTPRELTNEQGQIVWEAQYKTWGAIAKESYNQEESKITQSFRFQGQYFDAETGLHYNRFRYYDADIGRFISQDPIGLMGGVNLYQYAPNPVGWVDPFGLMKCKCDDGSTIEIDEINRRINKRGEIEKARKEAEKKNFVDENGNTIWPDGDKQYDGLPGTYKQHSLEEGDKVWRYSRSSDIEKYYPNGYDPKNDRGGYVTTPNTPWEKLSLPGDKSDYRLFEIEIGANTDTTRSRVTPWFNQQGRGVQDKLPAGVQGTNPKLIGEVKIE